MDIFDQFKIMSRVSKVMSVLASNSMGYYIHELGLRSHLPVHKQFSLNTEEEDSLPVRLRQCMEQLGGAYIKLGQFLSIRPDLVPQEYREEFSKLQDRVQPLPYNQISKIIEQELKQPLNKIFKSIEKTPIGSASIAQVHKAVLKSGEEVIIKVKRPGIEKLFEQDIAVLYFIAEKIEERKQYKNFAPKLFVQEFERYTLREMNLLVEAGYIDKFYNFFKTSKKVKTPKLYRDHCTKNIIVMELIKGKKLRELSKKELASQSKKIAETLIESLMDQLFKIGTFHADLHPGNILITKEGKVAFIDFGIIGSLSPELKKKGIDFYIATVSGDPDEIITTLLALGKKTSEFTMDSFRDEVTETITSWYNTDLSSHTVSSMYHRLLDISIQHRLQIPVDAILIGKSLLTLEGTCLFLYPKFNLVKFSEPHIKDLMEGEVKSKYSIQKFLKHGAKLKDIAYELPFQSFDLIKKLNNNEITLDIDDAEIKVLANNVNNSAVMLTNAMLISSFIMAMALILTGKLNLPQGILIIIFISIFVIAFISFMKRR